MSAPPSLKCTLAAYMYSEEKSLEKHEFYQGEIFLLCKRNVQKCFI